MGNSRSIRAEAGRVRRLSVAADWVSTAVAWALFNIVRFLLLKVGYVSFASFALSPKVMASQLLFPTAMLGVYWLTGYYNEPLRRSRLRELWLTAVAVFAGSLAVLLLMLLNDLTARLDIDYLLLIALFLLLLVTVFIPRAIITSSVIRRFESGRVAFRTAVIGDARACAGLLRRNYLAPVVAASDPVEIAGRTDLDCVFIESHSGSLDTLMPLVGALMPAGLPILTEPRSSEIVERRYGLGGPAARANRIDTIGRDILIDLSRTEMPASTLNIKRLSDIVISSAALIVTGPLILGMAAAVRLTSPGTAFYRQKRLGLHRRPFEIIKLRTMRADAEAQSGPALASAEDPRVTPLGRFMRKYRIDELPQFVNVLRGEMSLVGPRPERPHFVEQITRRVPSYTLVYQLRPGITSWGMVSFGYAKTVDEMVKRLRYDLLYLENVGFVIDIKILLYTIRTIITGKGL